LHKDFPQSASIFVQNYLLTFPFVGAIITLSNEREVIKIKSKNYKKCLTNNRKGIIINISNERRGNVKWK
jgi:hypothetical protein